MRKDENKILRGLRKGLFKSMCIARCFAEKLIEVLPQSLIVANPYISMFVVVIMYKERGCFRVGGEWLVPLFILLCTVIAQWMKDGLNETVDGCPVARKRFTKRRPDGAISFNKEDLYEMVEYLAEVEEYCEKNGKYRG